MVSLSECVCMDESPIKEIDDGVAYYFDSGGSETTRHEGGIEIYENWVRFMDPIGTWVPRENIEQVHEV